jgi:hypothetical protein
MNPDAVVALTTQLLSTSTLKNSLCHSQFNESKFRRDLNKHVNDRTAQVLDSIAGICVSKAKSDVVAIALKLSLPTVCFVVSAQDESRHMSITTHLQKVWNLLKNISDVNFESAVNMKRETHGRHVPIDAEIPLINELHSLIYCYSSARISKRLTKHSKRLTTLIDISKAFNQQNPGMNISIEDVDGKLLSIEEFMGKIVSMAAAICRYLNKKSEVNAERPDGLVQITNYQHLLAEALQRQSSPYNKWISQLKECK